MVWKYLYRVYFKIFNIMTFFDCILSYWPNTIVSCDIVMAHFHNSSRSSMSTKSKENLIVNSFPDISRAMRANNCIHHKKLNSKEVIFFFHKIICHEILSLIWWVACPVACVCTLLDRKYHKLLGICSFETGKTKVLACNRTEHLIHWINCKKFFKIVT